MQGVDGLLQSHRLPPVIRFVDEGLCAVEEDGSVADIVYKRLEFFEPLVVFGIGRFRLPVSRRWRGTENSLRFHQSGRLRATCALKVFLLSGRT